MVCTSEKQYDLPLTAHSNLSQFLILLRLEHTYIRKDYSVKNGLNLWVVADNLRKGAATNAIQIMEKLIEKEAN